MKAAIRCLIPRGLPAARAAAHMRPGATLVFVPPAVRAFSSGTWREAPAIDAESSAMRAQTEPTRPPSPRHLDILENSNTHLDGVVDLALEQQKDRLAATERAQAYFVTSLHAMMREAAKKEVTKPLAHWLGLVLEARAQLTTELCHAIVMMYIALGRPDIADSVWDTMMAHNIAPTVHTCTLMIRAWGRRRNVAAVDQWAERAEKAGFLEKDEIQYACMMAWGDCGEIERVFAWAEMRSTPIPTPFMYAFLTALGKAGLKDQFSQFCHGLFTSWADEGQAAPIPRLLSLDLASVVIRYHPDAQVAQNVFDSTQSRIARVSAAAKQHLSNNAAGLSSAQREARKDSSEIMSAMMARYFSEHRFSETLDVLDTVLKLELPPTPSLCVEVLRMHATVGNMDGVEAVWTDMVQHGILPEPEAFVFALKEFGQRKNIEAVDCWADRATAHGFEKLADVRRAMFAAWAQCGRPDRLLQWSKQNE